MEDRLLEAADEQGLGRHGGSPHVHRRLHWLCVFLGLVRRGGSRPWLMLMNWLRYRPLQRRLLLVLLPWLLMRAYA